MKTLGLKCSVNKQISNNPSESQLGMHPILCLPKSPADGRLISMDIVTIVFIGEVGPINPLTLMSTILAMWLIFIPFTSQMNELWIESITWHGIMAFFASFQFLVPFITSQSTDFERQNVNGQFWDIQGWPWGQRMFNKYPAMFYNKNAIKHCFPGPSDNMTVKHPTILGTAYRYSILHKIMKMKG